MTSKAENAYTALFTLLQSVTGLATINGVPAVSRTLTDPTQMAWENTPAIFMNETGEHIAPSKGFEGLRARQMLMCDLYLYVYNGGVGGACSTLMNNMLENIRAAIAPATGYPFQTLNETVSHCWVSGKIEIIEGVLNGQGVAIVPVEILTNY